MTELDACTSPRVLVAEDDPTTADLVALYLRHEGYRVEVVHDGNLAASRIASHAYDLLVLDVMLPGVDGRELCARAQRDGRTPVILVTARTREEDRIEGLDLGADDYVTKPFLPRELMARVRAVLRRAPPESGERLALGPLALDPEARTARFDGASVDLTATEFRILEGLVRGPRRVHSRASLLRFLPESGRNALDRTVDVHVRNLRRKLGGAGEGGDRVIDTVVGFGYRIDPALAEDAP